MGQYTGIIVRGFYMSDGQNMGNYIGAVGIMFGRLAQIWMLELIN